MINAKINEIFDSIQGEGPYIGYRQLFIRFCGCNLFCDYCDTSFDKGGTFLPNQLLEAIKKFDLQAFHSVSLTGGEPLLHYEFLKDFLPSLKNLNLKLYLETNGTLPKSLEQVINLVDIISMDIKLDSAAKIGDLYSKHKEFLEIAKKYNKEIFAKLVFDETMKETEFNETLKLVKEFNIPLILQPKMNGNEIGVPKKYIEEIFNKFSTHYHNTRMIGQVHKFFDIR